MRKSLSFAFRTLLTLPLAIVAICSQEVHAKSKPVVTSKGFVAPAAPTPSARPSTKLPQLGRDKHGMPFYHPKQLSRVVRTTAYTHTESDHVAYGAKNAIGTSLKYTDTIRSAAADWSVYPVGTKFRVKGQPYTYIIDDYGSALVGTGTIDFYQPTRAMMNKWGRRIVEIEVIEWGSSRQSMEKLASRTRYKHCAQMQAALIEQQRHRKTAQR